MGVGVRLGAAWHSRDGASYADLAAGGKHRIRENLQCRQVIGAGEDSYLEAGSSLWAISESPT
jgi:hypothetical protein